MDIYEISVFKRHLTELKLSKKIKSFTQLSEEIGVKRSFLSQVYNEIVNLTPEFAEKVYAKYPPKQTLPTQPNQPLNEIKKENYGNLVADKIKKPLTTNNMENQKMTQELWRLIEQKNKVIEELEKLVKTPPKDRDFLKQ